MNQLFNKSRAIIRRNLSLFTKVIMRTLKHYCPKRPYLYIFLSILAAICIGKFINKPKKWKADPTITRSFRFAAVATDSPNCHEIGLNVIGIGGNAVDGMIATAFCICAVHRHSCGIGGGFNAVIYAKPKNETEKRLVSIMSREIAPKMSSKNMFANMTAADIKNDVRTIGVPGEIAGLYKAWEMFGMIPWKDLVQPTVNLAKNGVIVTKHTAKAINENRRQIRKRKELKRIYYKNKKKFLEGDVIFDEKFANTLQVIAEDPLSFYNGKLAEDIVQDIQEKGGILTLDDLNSYSAKVADCINITLSNGNYSLYTTPPPTKGITLAMILKLLDKFNFDEYSLDTSQTEVETQHKMVEAFKFAYSKTHNMGEEGFDKKVTDQFLSDEYLDIMRKKIKEDSAGNDVHYYEPFHSPYHQGGTSHLNILADDGSAASYTTSINRYFGAMTYGSRTGIHFNNQLLDFSLPDQANVDGFLPSPNNFMKPGNRPASSMSPAIIFKNGKVVLVTGGAGGSAIPTGVATIIIRALWFGNSLFNAIDTKRLHHNLFPYHISYEKDFKENIIKELNETKRNPIEKSPQIINVVSAIYNECNMKNISPSEKTFCIHAGSDGRKVAEPDGF